MKTPREILDDLIFNTTMWIGRHSEHRIRDRIVIGKPGELIERLGSDARRILENLKSDDLSFSKIRKEYLQMFVEQSNALSPKYYIQLIKEAKLKFDKRLNKR
jgi:GTPase Era involved in 16S rRNA processing